MDYIFGLIIGLSCVDEILNLVAERVYCLFLNANSFWLNIGIESSSGIHGRSMLFSLFSLFLFFYKGLEICWTGSSFLTIGASGFLTGSLLGYYGTYAAGTVVRYSKFVTVR